MTEGGLIDSESQNKSKVGVTRLLRDLLHLAQNSGNKWKLKLPEERKEIEHFEN